jgi:hypothetical protein
MFSSHNSKRPSAPTAKPGGPSFHSSIVKGWVIVQSTTALCRISTKCHFDRRRAPPAPAEKPASLPPPSLKHCHPERSEGPASAFALVLALLVCHPAGICFFRCMFSSHNSKRPSAHPKPGGPSFHSSTVKGWAIVQSTTALRRVSTELSLRPEPTKRLGAPSFAALGRRVGCRTQTHHQPGPPQPRVPHSCSFIA